MSGLRAGSATSRGGASRRALVAMALAAMSLGVYASTGSAPFGVSVTLFPNFKDVAECGQTGAGGNVMVTCTSPESAQSASPRFMLELYRQGAKVGTVEGETAPGTVTSWKVYRVANRDFLEIVVGW